MSDRKTRRNPGRGASGLALGAMALAALACGGEEAPRPSGGSMAATPQSAEERAARTDDAGPGLNEAPVIREVRFEPERPKPGTEVRAVVTASDPDGDRVTLSYEWRVGRRGVVSTSDRLDTDGLSSRDRIELSVVASDGRDASPSQQHRLALANRLPDVAFVGVATPAVPGSGRTLRAEVDAVDADGDRVWLEYRWEVNGEKAGDDAVLAGRDLKPGDRVQVIVTARDGFGRTRPVASAPVRIAESRAPAITSQPGAVREDGEFRYRLTAEDPDGDAPLRFELLEGPDGMTLDESTGELHWKPTPDQIGEFTVDVSVSDPHGATAAQRFSLTVASAEPSEGSPASPAR